MPQVKIKFSISLHVSRNSIRYEPCLTLFWFLGTPLDFRFLDPQIALCHTFFNVSGILLFYVVPFMRWPVPIARYAIYILYFTLCIQYYTYYVFYISCVIIRAMGETVASYRWFAIFYLAFMFFLLPLYAFGLSLIGKSTAKITNF